jgi:hypothetical protein
MPASTFVAVINRTGSIVFILGALLGFMFAPCRFALGFVGQIGVYFVLFGLVGRLADGWLSGSFAHRICLFTMWWNNPVETLIV